jgi:hypothetical protein
MPHQDTKPTHVEASVEAKPSMGPGTVIGKLTLIVPLVIIIVIAGIVLLALLGPQVGNVYSYTGGSL